MEEHYVTTMSLDHEGFYIACRCGALFTGLGDDRQGNYEWHAREVRDAQARAVEETMNERKRRGLA